MGKIFSIAAFLMMVVLVSPRPIHAASVAGTSATMQSVAINTPSNESKLMELAKKKAIIRRVLERYNSPLVGSVDTFIKACDTYNLDCYLLPSIAGLESTFGEAVYPNSYNAFGWGGGLIMFNKWDDGIMTVAQGLRENYVNKGATTVDAIGPIYSESPTWAARVKNIMTWFEAEEDKSQLYFADNSVKL